MTHRLTDAFLRRDSVRILRYSADLGHYLADAHVPLHTTENYNGQLSDQTGIHAFWESRLPELFATGYDLFTGKAHYIRNIPQETWRIVRDSHRSEEHTSERQSLMRISYAVFCLKKKNNKNSR